MKEAQKQQQKQANKHHQELDFDVDDMVYVIDNSFKVALSDSVKVHPVFSPDKLHCAVKDLLPRQTLDEKPSIEVDDQLKYTVNCILASQIHYGKLKYHVDWLDYDDDSE
ncbi:hypothetical protein AJ79_10355 [Helicocarpus griseus UAMH5409]|uniref:Chromo domain-containing protein n=1 Tax=Helicocarpus griseus UAMH5409 TaxID=1447875 RepID=A0A2B7WEB7_9EURO|nr:hypothetical protein AJ79_10355 [Helicocarpus griseus UAMH5409]